MIVFMLRETLSVHSARPQKIHGWIILVHEKVSINKQAYRPETIEIVVCGFCLFSFSNFTLGCHSFHLKKFKILQYDF